MTNMPRAIWNNQVIAEAPASAVEHVEGNVYFPLLAMKRECLRPSTTHTRCFGKGIASYYDVKDHVAFWHGVKVEKSDA
jgi:uncharacterized protein (DUF427 family)